MLDSPDRLVRLWDRTWQPVGHVFTDVPKPQDGTILLRLPANDPVVSEGLALPHLNLSIGSLDPIGWTVTRWQRRGWQWLVTAQSFDHFLRDCIKPDWKFLDELRFPRASEADQ